MSRIEQRQPLSYARRVALPLAVLAAVILAPTRVSAALTDLSPTPLASTNSAQVKPNIMLLMDTSGSMGRTHMPDEVENFTNGRWGFQTIGYKSYQCNSLYYNPNTTYALPRQSDGTFFATAEDAKQQCVEPVRAPNKRPSEKAD
jgi:hypothetical protein